MMKKLLLLVTIFALALWVVPALATPCDFYIVESNFQSGNGPYAEVQVTVPSGGGDATVEFIAQDSFRFSQAGINVAGSPTYTFVSAVSGDGLNTALASTDFSGPSSGNKDGFGTFNFAFDGPNYGHDGFIDFKFTVSGSFASCSDVLVANSSGYFAYVEYQDTTISAPNTGFASGSSPVPIPPTALLMGSGLLGLVGLGWRRQVRS
jgi:hypothetical protein